MKIHTLKKLATLSCLTLSMQAMAVGYNSIANPVSGDLPDDGITYTPAAPGQQAYEMHLIQSYTTPGTCNSKCLQEENQESEVIILARLINQSDCTDNGNTTTGTRSCSKAPAVEDYYSGDGGAACPTARTVDSCGVSQYPGNEAAASGTPTDQRGVTPAIQKLQLFKPFATDTASGGMWRDVGTDGLGAFILGDWDFYTAPNGRIDRGHIVGNAFDIVGTFNFTSGIFTTYYGDIGLVNSPSKVQCLVDGPTGEGHTDTNNCQTSGDLPGLEFSRSFPFAYVNTDQNDVSISKSVPVPAFAAAFLGLGLVAITLLTGRRRQIS